MKRPDPRETRRTAEREAAAALDPGDDPVRRRAAIRRWLEGAAVAGVTIPLMFLLRFGEVGGVGWGATIFVAALCLLYAYGLHMQPQARMHPPARVPRDVWDRIGAFWLLACAFGPFLGWVVTAAFPVTGESWRWLYALRVLLAAGLPLLTAAPLTRYVQGHLRWATLILLVAVTALPLWSAVAVGRDLWQGPVARPAGPAAPAEWVLEHTGRSLGPVR